MCSCLHFFCATRVDRPDIRPEVRRQDADDRCQSARHVRRRAGPRRGERGAYGGAHDRRGQAGLVV
eukprot:1566807-Prymnesium_polylepis.1